MKHIVEGVAVLTFFAMIGAFGSYETGRLELGQALLWTLLFGSLFGMSALTAYLLPEKKKRPARRQPCKAHKQKISHQQYNGNRKESQEPCVNQYQ